MSPLVRGAWIENYSALCDGPSVLSPLVRGAWIEKYRMHLWRYQEKVAPRERGVD